METLRAFFNSIANRIFKHWKSSLASLCILFTLYMYKMGQMTVDDMITFGVAMAALFQLLKKDVKPPQS